MSAWWFALPGAVYAALFWDPVTRTTPQAPEPEPPTVHGVDVAVWDQLEDTDRRWVQQMQTIGETES